MASTAVGPGIQQGASVGRKVLAVAYMLCRQGVHGQLTQLGVTAAAASCLWTAVCVRLGCERMQGCKESCASAD
jgi:hypothetical protein